MGIKKKYILVIIIAMVFSTIYITMFEYYNRVPTDIQRLKELINIEEGKLDRVEIQLVGKNERAGKSHVQLQQMQEDLSSQMSHMSTCPKLCNKYHFNNAKVTTNNNGDNYSMDIVSDEGGSKYELMVVNQNGQVKSTKYNFNISANDNFELLDCRRDRLNRFLVRQDISPVENIYFEGEILGCLDDVDREEIAYKVLNKLGSGINGVYKSDIAETTSAYYGYTKEYDNYISASNGERSNVEINFSYDENSKTTKYIVAFPFCNKTY